MFSHVNFAILLLQISQICRGIKKTPFILNNLPNEAFLKVIEMCMGIQSNN